MKLKSSPSNSISLLRRSKELLERMHPCRICPHSCKAERSENQKGFCGIGRLAIVSAAFAHRGEERCISGPYGSGTIFFSGCTLGCVFCQNYELSHFRVGREETSVQIARRMLTLQESGCHNLNLVSPTHVIPQILEALVLAVEHGFHLPIVYNTGGYESVETLRLLEGIVDIYMPDFKYWDAEISERLSGVRDYPDFARRAILEMHRQVGDLVLDDYGIAQRGLLIRHLVLPHGLAGTREIMRFLATEISPNTYVNIMGQYHPCGNACEIPEINRPVTAVEIQAAQKAAREAGLYRMD